MQAKRTDKNNGKVKLGKKKSEKNESWLYDVE